MQAPIYLTGFSGTGKSTTGQALAFGLNRKFFDLDKEIELLSGLTIAQYIEKYGESKFRDFESQILISLTHTESSVIALGGGALMRESNLERVKSSGCLVYLSSTLDRIKQNLVRQSIERPMVIRPLIKSTDELELLFNAREPSYLKAHIILKLEAQSVKEISDQIVERHAAWVQHSTLN